LPSDQIGDIFCLALLRSTGCTATAHEFAAAVGDDIAFYQQFSSVNYVSSGDIFQPLYRYLAQIQPWTQRARTLATFVAAMPRMNPQVRISSHCEVAQQVAGRLGFGDRMAGLLFQTFERWDGRGMPKGLKGEAIDPIVRIVQLTEDAAGFYNVGGVDAALAIVRRGQGTAHDPFLVDAFCQEAVSLLPTLESPTLWDDVLDLEPTPHRTFGEDDLETIAAAIADFADLKSPYLVGHSRGVARVAAAAAQRLGLSDSTAQLARTAGLIHDLGRTAISNRIWDKPGPLTNSEWESVRLHPYYTDRFLVRAGPLAAPGSVGAMHHERPDGSGYPKGLPGTLQSTVVRLLEAADAFQAMTEPRQYRAPLSVEQAADGISSAARARRLDPEVVEAIGATLGLRRESNRRAWPANLTDREVEVLRLIARGDTTRQIAQALSISAKTADHHIQHIYDKIGTSTRAAATYFAMQHDLIGDSVHEI
jgi:HD-GYP domain-containing protein (c-di-GMP phosphodiesterase class II)